MNAARPPCFGATTWGEAGYWEVSTGTQPQASDGRTDNDVNRNAQTVGSLQQLLIAFGMTYKVF